MVRLDHVTAAGCLADIWSSRLLLNVEDQLPQQAGMIVLHLKRCPANNTKQPDAILRNHQTPTLSLYSCGKLSSHHFDGFFLDHSDPATAERLKRHKLHVCFEPRLGHGCRKPRNASLPCSDWSDLVAGALMWSTKL